MGRTLESAYPGLAAYFDSQVSYQLLTSGDSWNQPIQVPVSGVAYGAYQKWLWGTTLVTRTKWRGILLVPHDEGKFPEAQPWIPSEPLS